MKIQGIINIFHGKKSIETFISPLITFCWILNSYFSVSMSLNIYPILPGALVLRRGTSLMLSCLRNQVPKIRLILHSRYYELSLIFPSHIRYTGSDHCCCSCDYYNSLLIGLHIYILAIPAAYYPH